MDDKMTTDMLLSVMTRLYEQIFLLDNNAVGGMMIHEGNWVNVESFNVWCKDNFEECYEGDDITLFLQKIASESIVEALGCEDEYIVEFSVVEADAERRKCMKAFACGAENLICICIDDITQQYFKDRSRERVAGESLKVAQQAVLVMDHFFEDMNDDIQLPVTQAVEMLEASLQKDHEDAQAYVEKAITVLKKYANTIDGMFSFSALERGEDFEKDDVIFTSDFVSDLEQMAALQTDGAVSGIAIGSTAKRLNGFVSDQLRLKQMLGNALATMILQSVDQSATALLDFDIRKETDTEEEAIRLAFSICAAGIKEDILKNPCMKFVHRLVEHMDGNIYIKTEEENASLSIAIPVQRADMQQQRKAKIQSRMTDSIGAKDFAAYRALVIDDDAIGREIVVSKLEQFGLGVETAADGEEAMEKLLASPGRYYQVIFTKMSLPKKSGLDLTMELREMTRRDLNDITIVAVTTDPQRDRRLTALEHGMDYHMILPFNDIELKEILLRELEDLGPEDAHEKFGFRILK